MRTTREEVSKQLGEYYSSEYERITGLPSKVWSYFDESKRAYCLRGENLPSHPDLRAQGRNGWSLLDYIKPTEARRLIVEQPRIETAND